MTQVMTALVAAGPTAIPRLIACLNDQRPARLGPIRGMEWQSADDEYDWNHRTTRPPAGVNLSRFKTARDLVPN